MQVHYLSSHSQNEFIKEYGRLVLCAILEEVKRAFYDSIAVGETPDTSHTEQIASILRYVYQNMCRECLGNKRAIFEDGGLQKKERK